MKRPLALWAVAFVLGEGLFLLGEGQGVKNVFVGGLVIAMITGFLFVGNYKKTGNPKWTCLFFFLGIGFFFLGFLRIQQESNCQVRVDQFIQEEREQVVCGRLLSIREGREENLYLIKTKNLGKLEVCLEDFKRPDLVLGEYLTIRGRIEAFEPAYNPGNFNRKTYQASQACYGRIANGKLLKIQRKWSIFFLAGYVHQKARTVLMEICPKKHRGELLGILLGERWEIPREIKDLYQLGGISHVLAISGLHISILGLTLFTLLRKCCGYYVSALCGISFVLFFGLVTGSSIATMRAVCMLSLAFYGQAIGASYDGISGLSLAVIILLIQNPMGLFQSGFLLSVGAVAGVYLIFPSLILGMESKERHKHLILTKWKDSFAFSLAIQLAILPILTWSYFKIYPYGLLLNLLVIPCLSVLVGTSFFSLFLGFFLPSLGQRLFHLPCWILSFYKSLCSLVKRLPGFTLVTGKPRLGLVILYYVLVFGTSYFIKKRGQRVEKESYVCQVLFCRRRRVLWGILIPVLFFILCFHPVKDYEIHLLDVGQGDGIVFCAPDGSNFLIDGGSTSVSDVGNDRMLPFLQSKGITHLQGVVFTHPDKDHVCGTLSLLEKKEILVDQIYLSDLKDRRKYKKILAIAKRNHCPVRWLSRGDCFSLGSANFQVLWPYAKAEPEDINQGSLVLGFSYQGVRGIFTGDAEADFEKDYSFGKVDFIKVGHHGSKNASSLEFLRKCHPDCALISAGRNNCYGHPHKETLERLKEAGCRIYRTDLQGCIMITIGRNDKETKVIPFVSE